MVGNSLHSLPPEWKAGPVGESCPGSQRRHVVACKETLVWRGQRSETENEWRPAGQTRLEPVPTCGQHFSEEEEEQWRRL